MKNRRNDIPIVLAFTPNYLVPAAVVISSILKHSSNEERFHVICLLTDELPTSMKDSLLQVGSDRVSFSYINLQGRLKDIYIDQRYTEAASYRLLLPNLLPDYDKVIYIDCDVVVRNDLAKLFRETDLHNYYLAGVFEATLDFQYEYLKSIHVQPGQYINSGFLVMNLLKMREDDMVDKLLEASKVPYLQFPDQDVLNQLCEGKILGLPPYFNGIRTFYLPQYKNDFLKFYSEDDWNAVQEHGTIHYTGSKPWNSFTVKFDVWWTYFYDLPKSLKVYAEVNSKMKFLYKLYAIGFGKILFKPLLNFYRNIK